MPTLAESLSEPLSTPIHDALAAGVDVLGQNQQVEFWPYVRVVLPVDGFVFWLRADLLTPTQLAQHGLQTPLGVQVDGSLHYASIGHQVEDEVIAIRRVDFTAETQITALAEIAPDVMYVAEWTTSMGSFKFTFSQRSTYYQQADIHHYVGDAVYPAFAGQLIDDVAGFDQRQVVSNSLPFWLSMFSSQPFPSPIGCSFPIYPAFLLPPNLTPPYIATEISGTRALQSVARIGSTGSRSQLCSERVRLIAYGMRNDDALTVLDYSLSYMENTDFMGLMNMPVVVDEHRPQVELAALAQKKVIEYEVSYNQSVSRAIALQVIKKASPALVQFYLSGSPIRPRPVPIIPTV